MNDDLELTALLTKFQEMPPQKRAQAIIRSYLSIPKPCEELSQIFFEWLMGPAEAKTKCMVMRQIFYQAMDGKDFVIPNKNNHN